MSRVFMGFATSGETLFEARCGAKDFFDSLKGLPSGGLLLCYSVFAATNQRPFSNHK